jgi:hypothetical protein
MMLLSVERIFFSLTCDVDVKKRKKKMQRNDISHPDLKWDTKFDDVLMSIYDLYFRLKT